MNIIKFKEALLNTGIFERVHSTPYQYKCQYCPFCGDGKYHMYVKINTSDESPVLYNCKKCNASGILNRAFLEYYGVDDIDIPKNGYRKGFRKLDTGGNVHSSNDKLMVSVNENDDYGESILYMEERVGCKISLKDLQSFQYVGNPYEYAKEYLGYNGGMNYFNKRCWFKLTNGGIVGRYMGDHHYRWMFCRSDRLSQKGLYQMRLPIDTHKIINAVITEGIMDGIGMYYWGHVDNGVYISCLGSDYERGIEHLIDLGLFGETVNVGVYIDGDINVDRIRFDKRVLSLFGKVDIYRNTLSKDYGVKGDEIMIEKVRRLI
jgi:hypothetical protein